MSFFKRLRNTLTGHSVNDELSAHLDLAVEDLVSRGMTEAEARQEARKRFGPPARLREETRDVDVLGWLDGLLRDLRFAVRGLTRNPGFFWTSTLSLGIGIGACCAIFAVADAALFAPLPVSEPERLVTVAEFRDGRPVGGNAPRMRDWGQAVSAFESVMGLYGEGATLLGRGQPRRVEVARLFGDSLRVLRAEPVAGRPFDEAERLGRGEPVAMITDRFWQREFAGQPSALGAALNLGGTAVTIIGVLPPSFRYPPDLDLLIPAPAGLQQGSRDAGYLYVIGRLKPGAALELAQEQAASAARWMVQEYPQTDRGISVQLRPLLQDLGAESRGPVLAMLGTVLAVLLIACVNIASLLLARAAERQREGAIRAALGAGQASLVRLHLAECAVLAAAGAGVGLLVASAALDFLKAQLPFEVHRLNEAAIDGRVLLFSLALTIACLLIFGLLTSIQASRVQLVQAILDGGRGTSGPGRRRVRAVLVVVQVALSAVLLSCAGHMTRSLLLIRQAPLGFSAENVYTLRVDFPWDTPDTRLARFIQETEAAVGDIPGVLAVGVMDRLPLGGGTQTRKLAELRGKPLPPAAAAADVAVRGMTPGVLKALSLPLLAGEALTLHHPARHVMINLSMAKALFGSPQDAVGRQFRFESRAGSAGWWTIAGVAGDFRQSPADLEPPLQVMARMNEVYWPMLNITVRAAGSPDSLRASVRSAVQRLAPDQVLGRDAALSDEVERAYGEPKLLAGLFGAFAVAALALALIGLVGVLAGEAASRRREIGIRLALGASPRGVAAGFAWRGLRLTLLGLGAGAVASIPVGRLLSGLMFGLAPNDPLSVTSAAAILCLSGAAASFLTSRQAVRLDPAECLRHD
jgi:predicted permease